MPRLGSGRRPHILVVDDEPDICWALENILRPAGFTVTTTTRGAEALKLIADRGERLEHPYAVAFVDAKIPDLDGLELAGSIHQQSPDTAIVLISGYFYEEDRAVNERLENGLFAAFISKPFDVEKVRLMARRAVEVAATLAVAPREENHADDPHSAGG